MRQSAGCQAHPRDTLPHTTLKRFLATVLAALITAAQAVPQEQPLAVTDIYTLGHQTLSLSPGLLLPLFTYLPGDQVDSENVTGTNLSPGGHISLRWNAFVNPRLAIGAEVGGMFAIDRHGEALLMVPATVRMSYLFSFAQFDVPLFANAGLGFMKLADLFNVSLILRPGVSFHYRYDANWSFGGTVSFWMIYEPLWNDPPPEPAQNAIATFVDISPQIVYHF